MTIVVTLALMLPTQLLLHLRLPRWRGLVEILTLLPLVFPPVVLVVGVSDVYACGRAVGRGRARAGRGRDLPRSCGSSATTATRCCWPCST